MSKKDRFLFHPKFSGKYMRFVSMLTDFFLVGLIFFGLTACDDHASRPHSKTGAETLDFVESSTGLPTKGQWRHGLAFYDMNQDGHMDILAPAPRKASEKDRHPFIWLGNGKGEWALSQPQIPSTIPYDYGGIAAGDFNGDGIPDMALAIHVESLTGLKGEGNAKYVLFSEGLPKLEEFASRALVADDFNNDGIADFAAISEGRFGKKTMGARKGARICLGSNDEWQCHVVGDEERTKGLFADKIISGDVNGDGNADIGIGSLQHKLDLIVWLGDGKGGFKPFNQGLMTERHYRSIAFADVNRDGRDDLIASITGFGKDGTMMLRAYLSGQNGFSDFSLGLPEKEAYLAVAAGDLNGDGIPEIAGVTAAGGLKVFGLKDEKWHLLATPELPEEGLYRIWDAYCVDLNADGLDDIVVNYGTEKNNAGAIRVFLSVPSAKQTSKAH
jgi:hypothetical protein